MSTRATDVRVRDNGLGPPAADDCSLVPRGRPRENDSSRADSRHHKKPSPTATTDCILDTEVVRRAAGPRRVGARPTPIQTPFPLAGGLSLSLSQKIKRLIGVLACVGGRRSCRRHTRLYSFRFNCSMVSLTAANTNRMFSVSAAPHHTKRN